MAGNVRYLVFDVESAADGALVSKLRYPGEGLSPADAIARYRRELMEKHETDFIPYTFQIPVAIVAAKVDEGFRLVDLVALDEPAYRSHVMTDHFWRGWEAYRRPTLVSFNGRSFDLPLLELAAFRYGLSAAGWFNAAPKSYDQPRSRYNQAAHLDLHDLLTNFGASRFTGGLNLAANLLGKPGKMDVQGHMVQDLVAAGELARVSDYCRCDVLDTYFVFLRSRVLVGQISLAQEQELLAAAREWLSARSEKLPIYADYLAQWGDWTNPWKAEGGASGAESTEGKDS